MLIGFDKKHGNRICLHKSGGLIGKHCFYSGSLAGLKGTGVFKDVFLAVIVEYVVRETVRRRDLRLIDASHHFLQMIELHASVIGNAQNLMD